jgi:hypothetical protein
VVNRYNQSPLRFLTGHVSPGGPFQKMGRKLLLLVHIVCYTSQFRLSDSRSFIADICTCTKSDSDSCSLSERRFPESCGAVRLSLRGGNDKDFKQIVFTKKTPKPPPPKTVRADDDAVPLPSVPHELKMAIMKARQV